MSHCAAPDCETVASNVEMSVEEKLDGAVLETNRSGSVSVLAPKNSQDVAVSKTDHQDRSSADGSKDRNDLSGTKGSTTKLESSHRDSNAISVDGVASHLDMKTKSTKKTEVKANAPMESPTPRICPWVRNKMSTKTS